MKKVQVKWGNMWEYFGSTKIKTQGSIPISGLPYVLIVGSSLLSPICIQVGKPFK